MSSTGVLNHCTFLLTLHLCKKQADIGSDFFMVSIRGGSIDQDVLVTLHLSKVHADTYRGYFHELLVRKPLTMMYWSCLPPMRK